VKLETVPFDANDAAARATGKLAELGTTGIILLPPETAVVASVVDETMSCLLTAAWFTLEIRAAGADVCCDVVVTGCDRQASSLAFVLPA